jgi:hypothetical protein
VKKTGLLSLEEQQSASVRMTQVIPKSELKSSRGEHVACAGERAAHGQANQARIKTTTGGETHKEKATAGDERLRAVE